MNKFVVYNSSAGSGKTYTLVKEYLKIALENDNPRQYKSILATTFTNKAAAEMKERVVEALQALSGKKALEGTPKFLLADLIQPKTEGGLGVSPEVVAERSNKVLSSILHNYNDFGISTIDKFTHKIIRTFAHDLHLPLNFEIVIDDNEVLGNAIDMLIAQVGQNEKLTQLLIEYTKKKANDEENWHIEKDLFQFAKNLLKDDGELHLQNIRNLSVEDFKSIKTQLFIQTKEFEDTVKQMALDVLELIKQKGVEHKSFSASYFPKYFIGLTTLKKLTPSDSVIKTVNGEKNWYAKTVDTHQQQIIDENVELFTTHFNEVQQYIAEFESQYMVNKLLIKNLYNLAVLNEIEKTVLEFKKENNVLNISDFNKKIAQIVADEPIPFIYERLGEKFNHYLIDEFQDTSIVQWHNIIPLIDNSLGTGKLNMVVGDAKQAIYRFRGGEVEQIINLPEIYNKKDNPLLIEREDSLKRNHLGQVLSNNFRSKAEVVNFNNRFFQSIAPHLSEKYQPLYKDLEQGFDAENDGGGVSIEFLNAINREELEEQTFEKILALINQNVADNYHLKDITILTRGNKDGAAIASYLLAEGIRVISSESLLINSSDEVQLIISLFNYLEHPTNKQFQLEIIDYLIQKQFIKDDVFEVFSENKTTTLESYLTSKNLNIPHQLVVNFSLYELTEYLIQHFNLDKKVDVYLQFFLDKVHEYASRKDNSVINFLEWWDTKKEKFSIVIPEGIDAVRIMSIHKSKGLEFPVVIYPFATSEVKLSEKYFWTTDTGIEQLKSAILPINKDLQSTKFITVHNEEMDKSTLDLMNVLYVALTRPKERLFILSQIKFNKGGKRTTSTNGSVSGYLFDFCEENSSNQAAENVYHFGEFKQKAKTEEELPANEMVSNITYNSWRKKIKVSYQAPEFWEVEQPETTSEYGNLFHKILSKIEYQKDVDKVLNSFLVKGLIAKNQFDAIKLEIENLFKIDKVQDVFNDFDELKNEREILLQNGEWYKPDRVVVKKNRTYIVDYKTGEKEKKHIEQITNYKVLLSEMGYKNINSYLLYTKDAELKEV